MVFPFQTIVLRALAPCHSNTHWSFFGHLQQLHMSTCLYQLDGASGFLAHTTGYTWIWVTPGLQQENGGGLGRRGSWSISLFQASQNLPGLLLSKLCLLCSHVSDWDECHADLLPVFWRLYTPGVKSLSHFLLRSHPHPITNSSEHRGPHMVCCGMIETAFLCHPGHGKLSLSIICEAAVMVIDFDLPPCVREYLNLHQRKI